MIEDAYSATQGVFEVDQERKLKGGMDTLNLMEIFPPEWPLAKLTLPLKSFVHRLDRLIAGYLMEMAATHRNPDQCHKHIAKSAKLITVRVATYLAEVIASLFKPVIHHPNMILFDDDTEP